MDIYSISTDNIYKSVNVFRKLKASIDVHS